MLRKALISLGLLLAVALILLATWLVIGRVTLRVPPANSSITEVRPTPGVLVAVRSMARLESVSFHMERVLDLSDKQSRLFGLIESEDALLLVAVANVTAGVDLGKLDARDIVVDSGARRVAVRLPDAEVFSAALDNEHTYVHTRRTGLIAQRKEDLESRARAEAERAMLDAARQAGILSIASRNAKTAVEALLRSLGFDQIEVMTNSSQDKPDRGLR